MFTNPGPYQLPACQQTLDAVPIKMYPKHTCGGSAPPSADTLCSDATMSVPVHMSVRHATSSLPCAKVVQDEFRTSATNLVGR